MHGRHDRQPVARRLHDGQPIGLDQSGIDEHPTRARRQGVQAVDLRLRVRFGIGNLAVEIVPVDRGDEIMQHPALLRFGMFQPVSQSGDDHQVAVFAQPRIAGKRFHQRAQILLLDRTRDGKNHRPRRIAQERFDQAKRLAPVLIGPHRRRAGHQPLDLARVGGRIGEKLPLAFVAGRADDGRRAANGSILFG